MKSHPNLCHSKNSLLLIVDIQTKLLAAMPKLASEEVINKSGRLITAAKSLSVPVWVTEQYPTGLGPTHPEISEQLPVDAPHFEKTSFSCCSVENFLTRLKASGRTKIILAGQEAHVCVLQTALELIAAGLSVYIVEDAVCSRNAEHKFYALNRLSQQNVTITNYESVLFEWLENASHPQFKALMALLD
ncbi:MAG: hydrolase [Methylococcales bacterium]|jgi:nicotinamidase-related amidase|nr:hydrolase [Methylococcales bacterium]